MKPISTTAVLAAMAVALISSSSVQAQTTLTMWSRQGEALPALVEAFNSGHETQVDLQLVPSDQMVQKYATSAAGGSAPDIIGLDLIYTPAFAAAGQLEDLSSLAQGLPYFDQLSKAHVEAG
jgi:multiple sugar transport system substrate-binding protein